MYDVKTRMQLSSIVPLLLLATYLLRVINLYSLPQRPTNQELLIEAAWFMLSILTLYLLSVIFFSLENIIRAYITDADAPESSAFKNDFEKAPLGEKLKVLFRWDSVGQNKITRSVVLQVALVVFTLFALTSSYSIIGFGLGLSILLQMLIDQVQLLRKNRDASVWFWQIRSRVPQDTQNIYVSVMGISFLVLLALVLR